MTTWSTRAFPEAGSGSTRRPGSYLPWALLGLPIGAYVDRSSPAAVAAGANIGRAILLTGLSVALLAGHRSLAVLYVAVFLLGVGEAAYDNAAQSLLPQVVADAALERPTARSRSSSKQASTWPARRWAG
jgi:MFS family permease